MTSPLASIHLSNALTYVSLAAGMLALAAAMQRSVAGTGIFLALSALADTFDGRFARLFSRDADRQALGAELDSLADAASFGVIPIAAVSVLLGAASGGPWTIWWIASIVYAGCALTRLAFYNVSHDPEEVTGFVGVPTPVAALVWSSALVFGPTVISASIVAVTLGLAMVAPLHIGRPKGGALTVFVMWPLTLLVVHIVRIT